MKLQVSLFLGLASLLTPASAIAQITSADSALMEVLLETETVDCKEYYGKAVTRIIDYYEAGKKDSCRMITEFMEKHCISTDFARLDTLLAIESGSRFEDWCDTTSFPFFRFDYGIHNSIELYDNRDARIKFEVFIANLAHRLIDVVDEGSMTELIINTYLWRREETLLKLKHNGYEGSCIQEFYDAKVEEHLKDWHKLRIHAAINLGIWSPTDAGNTLHTKLEFGAQLGHRRGRVGTDLTVLLRALKEPNEYQVEIDGMIENTRSFFGGLAGVDVTLEAIRLGRSSFEVFVGAGYDGIRTYSKDGGVRTINELAGSVGGTFRFFHDSKRKTFFGIQLRHNFVSYNGGGSDLSGNTFSLNLIYGVMINSGVQFELERLKYYGE